MTTGACSQRTAGPLDGVRVVELAGLGPAPYGVMLLADLGADVIRVERPNAAEDEMSRRMVGLCRNRRSVILDLKSPTGVQAVLELAAQADVLVEGFRPGVVERLGVGPDDCRARNERLIYVRMTGYGQDGSWSTRAGHDLNYVSLAGLLHTIGPSAAEPPVAPGYDGDFGGGGTFLALGVVAALYERSRSGLGQVVDVSIIDGAASLTSFVQGLIEIGEWALERGANEANGAAPYYRTYSTSDGGFISVGAMEPRFYQNLLVALGLDPERWPQHDRALWPALQRALGDRFLTRTRDEWEAHFADTDVCVAPVLDPLEARTHPHLRERDVFTEAFGVIGPRPVPRFSRTDGSIRRPAPAPGEHTAEVLGKLSRAFSPGSTLA